jgi:hypothetical protein
MKENARRERIELLCSDFGSYIAEFDRACPFSASQRNSHMTTIERRRKLGSAIAALNDDLFLTGLRETLVSWKVGTRAGTILVGFYKFKGSLIRNSEHISSLDGLIIDEDSLDIDRVSSKIWKLIDDLEIVVNSRGERVLAPVVSGTKTLLHILPDLVPPMDREYTQAFFGWHNPEFQYRQEYCFKYIFRSMAMIARRVKPSLYVGTGWHTSTAKIMDSAIVGFCLAHDIKKTP